MAAIFDTPIRTDAHNVDRVLATGKPLLLVFETADCEPCRALAPALGELAKEFAGRALIVRVEDASDLAGHFRLTRVPTLIAWRDDREIARAEGAVDVGTARAYLQFLLGAGPQPAAAGGPSIPLGGRPAGAPSTAPGGSGPSAQTRGPASSAQDGAPVVVTDATFESQVLRSPLPILVDFWAPWCGPCRMVSPIVEELGRQYAGRLRVAKVNTDEHPAHASRLGIMGIPTLIFFKNGREVDRVVGAVPKSALQSRVERVLSGG